MRIYIWLEYYTVLKEWDEERVKGKRIIFSHWMKSADLT